jgi:hypothetical protein
MKRSVVALGTLLALSAALNGLLLAQRRPPSSPPPFRPSSAVSPAVSSPREAFDIERRRVESLESRIRELEAEKAILAELGPAAVDRLGGLRERLRSYLKLCEQPESFNDPAGQLEYSETAVEIQRITLNRSRNSKAYVDLLRMVYEMALETPPLPDAARALVGKVFDDLGTAIAGMKADSAGERLVKELELEGAAMERLRQAVGAERALQLTGSPLVALTGGFTTMSYVQANNGDEEVLGAWASTYGLDPAQREAARPAARAFTAELERLAKTTGEDPNHLFLQPGTPEYYRQRQASLQAQLSALARVEGTWTREQRERFRTREPRNFHLMTASAVFSLDEEENK